VLSGGSFASSNDLRVHFGLGDASKIECLEIRWPSGIIEKVNLAGVDKIVDVGGEQR
jgi:enediyne biosynthesis protein E4